MFKLIVVILAIFTSCAIAGNRIFGGQPIDITGFPFQVSIMRNGVHECGGTIYSENIVITAAHCVLNYVAQDITIRAGSTYSHKDGVILPAAKIQWHEDYSKDTKENDIAIIKLDGELTFSQSIRPLELATTTPMSGEPAVVSGWGITSFGSTTSEHLMYTNVNIISKAECASDSYGFEEGKIVGHMICAAAPGSDACLKDSGGPLVAGGVLVGVVSWGRGCANPNFPGVYADVAQLHNWLMNTINSI